MAQRGIATKVDSEQSRSHLQRYSGAWVFRGTRVPVSSLFENLEADVSISEYVDAFEGVTIEQVRSVLDRASGGSYIEVEVP